MPESRFDAWVAERYDALWPELFDPTLVEPTVDFLGRLGGQRPGAGVRNRYRADRSATEPARHPGARRRTRPSPWRRSYRIQESGRRGSASRSGTLPPALSLSPFTLVYLLRNTITNLTSQDEQIEAFRNAARHLRPGGHFVIESYVPELRRLPPGETRQLFTATPTHVAFEEYDVVTQIAVSHHYWVIDDAAAAILLAASLCVAGRTRSHGADRRADPARPLGQLGSRTLHR